MHAAPQLNLVVIRSPDIDRSAAFFGEIGLLFERHSHGSGPQHYTSEVDGLVFEIYPLTPKTRSTNGIRIGFRVDAVDQIVDLLLRRGAEVVTSPADSEWGRRAVVRDLDGHIIELLDRKGG